MKDSLLVKENPLAISYIKILKIFLLPLGGWPSEVLGEHLNLIFRFHRRYVPFQGIFTLVGQVIYIFLNFDTMDFFLKGHCYITIFLSVATIIRTYLPWFKKYGEIVKEFLMSFHLMHYKNKGEYSKKIYIVTHKLSYYYTLFMSLMMIFGMILFNISPILQNYKNGVFTSNRIQNSSVEFSIYFTYTGYDPANQFVPITLFNFILSYNCAVWVCSLDCLLSLFVFQIIGHILILKNDLERFPKPKKQIKLKFSRVGKSDIKVVAESFDAEDNLFIHKMLVDCIDHHRLIVAFTNNISDFFGPVLAANYLFHLFSCCLLLLECSQGDPNALVRFGPLTIIIFGQLVQLSLVFEVVGLVSEKLKNSVYYLPWESMDGRNRRTVYILLNRVQDPIRVTALGSIPVGVTTMAQIIKTTLSYYTILRSMNE